MGWLDKKSAGTTDDKTKTAKVRVKETTAVPNAIETSSPGEGTIIGPGLEVEGQLKAAEDIYIAGRVEGEVHCRKKVVVAASGGIDGMVKCGDLVIFGKVHGDVEASGQVTIEETGKLVGDMRTRVFINRRGGFFEGNSRMLEGKARSAAQEKQARPAKQELVGMEGSGA